MRKFRASAEKYGTTLKTFSKIEVTEKRSIRSNLAEKNFPDETKMRKQTI
jgi:hypothetical protein